MLQFSESSRFWSAESTLLSQSFRYRSGWKSSWGLNLPSIWIIYSFHLRQEDILLSMLENNILWDQCISVHQHFLFIEEEQFFTWVKIFHSRFDFFIIFLPVSCTCWFKWVKPQSWAAVIERWKAQKLLFDCCRIYEKIRFYKLGIPILAENGCVCLLCTGCKKREKE